MDCVDLRGTYAEIGRRQGDLLRQAGFQCPPPDPRMLAFARRCEPLLAEHAPELLTELNELGEAAGLDRDALLTLALTAPYDPSGVPAAACTVLAVLPGRTVDGRLIVGRNYDFFHDVSAESATTYRVYPQGAHASLGNCDIWIGREDGLNDAGLFVGQAAFFERGLKPGLTFWFLVRLVLDRCASVEQGVDLLARVPHAASWTYLLADAAGHAAVIEPTVDGVAVRYAEDSLLVLTNHAVCPEWRGRKAWVPPDSRPRYRRLRELLGGEKKVDLEMVRSALRDHKGLVCSHGAHIRGRAFGTLWSLVGRPGERHLEIADGNPCRSEYRRVEF